MEKLINQTGNQKAEPGSFFSDALKKIIADFSARSGEIIFARFGVLDGKALTLEEIGKKYSITRERVRQVIREVLKKVKDRKNDPMFDLIKERIILALTENGGIMKEKELLLVLGDGNANEAAAVSFFLQCVSDIVETEIKGEMVFSYTLPGFEVEKWRKVKDAAKTILAAEKKPLTIAELHKLIKAEHEALEITEEHLASHLKVAEEIKKNTFGKWGIAKWKEISPKGTREKAYLILKEAGKPMHFRDIAKKIDEHNLNKKKTHPQTVHNELIKDKNFVLVGRGIYALVEWGYKKGTVKDVIEEIIAKSTTPLSKDEILKKVLEVRHVKKSTIIINLNNFFAKAKNGAYSAKVK